MVGTNYFKEVMSYEAHVDGSDGGRGGSDL